MNTFSTDASPVRVRVALAPTARCHIVAARSMLLNYLFARQRNGQLVLRIDDTAAACDPSALERLRQDLHWLGITWNEGPLVGGAYGPYFQSERRELYEKYAHRLIEEGAAYYCFCTEQKLGAGQATVRAGSPETECHCHELGRDTRRQGRDVGNMPAVRFRLPKTIMEFHDGLMGTLRHDLSQLADPIIVRSDGLPTYNFASTVDEHEMQITHVLRGTNHVSNTYIQMALGQALRLPSPQFAHFGLLLGRDGGQMVDRDGPLYVDEFRKEGYVPTAVVNQLALSGWTPRIEKYIFDMNELLGQFEVQRCSRTNSMFDYEKLRWINKQHIRMLATEDLLALIEPIMISAGHPASALREDGRLRSLVEMHRARIETLKEVPSLLGYFFAAPPLEQVLDVLGNCRHTMALSHAQLASILKAYIETLGPVPEAGWNARSLEDMLQGIPEVTGHTKLGCVMVLRIVVSGREATPSLYETVALLGKAEVMKRLAPCVAALEQREQAPGRENNSTA